MTSVLVGLTVFAVVFIRAISTVSETVALPAAMDTAAIVTLKLVRATGARRCRGNGKTESQVTLQAKPCRRADL